MSSDKSRLADLGLFALYAANAIAFLVVAFSREGSKVWPLLALAGISVAYFLVWRRRSASSSLAAALSVLGGMGLCATFWLEQAGTDWLASFAAGWAMLSLGLFVRFSKG